MSISVLIPAYNAEETIGRAIDSVLAQTHPVDEIVVVNDGSTDTTGKIVARYGAIVQYLRKENGGVSSAKNYGLRETKGEWIAFLDADDEWTPDKLETQLGILDQFPDLVWCFCHVMNVPPTDDNDGEPNGRIRRILRRYGYLPSFLSAAATGLTIQTSGMIIRSDVIKEAGGFDESLPRGGDMDLWMRIAMRYPAVGYAPTAHSHYYNTPGSLVRKYDSVPPGFLKLKNNLFRARGTSLQIQKDFMCYARRISFRYFMILALGNSELSPDDYVEYRRLFPLGFTRNIALAMIRATPKRIAPRIASIIRQIYKV